MSPLKHRGIVLDRAGRARPGATASFSYTKETHKAEIGPLKLQVSEKENRERAAVDGYRRDRARRGAAGRGPKK
jgi:hypothetical protein